MSNNLQEIRQWAKDKIASGQEPPWAWYQYMKLIETVDAILAGMDCVNPRENLPQLEQHQDARLRLVDSTYQRDTAQFHPDTVAIPLPM
jgi:tetrahydrodipicolinate N-succinyltransferase